MTSLEDIVSTTVHLRTAQLAANIEANGRLMAVLAGRKPKPLTRAERIANRFRLLKGRAQDAWLVLTGRAYAESYDA